MSAKREHLSCGSPHEVRAKKVCRCSAAQDFVRSFVLFSVFRGSSFFSVTMKSHERHEQKNAKLLGSGELFKVQVDPFALTSCGLPQKTNQKSEIQNPKSKCAAFRKEDQSAHPIPRVVLTMRTPTPGGQHQTTNGNEMPLLRHSAASLRRRFCLRSPGD
jgi:hypothetical protein